MAAAGLIDPLPLVSGQDRLSISAGGRARLARSRASGETRFLAQHLALRLEIGEETRLLRGTSESSLAWMARRRGRDGAPLIDAPCFEAGERQRRDITQAGVLPRMAPDWAAPRADGSSPRDPASASNRAIAACQRVERALETVGSDMSGLLIDLCGFLKGLEAIKRKRGWPPRSAKVVARMALARLAEHYGLAREATGPDRSRLRLWRAPENRTAACG